MVTSLYGRWIVEIIEIKPNSPPPQGSIMFSTVRSHVTETLTHFLQILPKGVINLEVKKILVRLSQAETTKGKNIIIGESREKVRPTTKNLKPTFDEPSAKYKKGNTHTKGRQNRNVQKVKPELRVSPHQADVLVVG
jgi:hypothetical protein